MASRSVRIDGSFWEELDVALNAAAVGLCRGAALPLHIDRKDLVQSAMLVAVEFYGASLLGRTVTPELEEQRRKEAGAYAFVAMKNSFFSIMRKQKNWRKLTSQISQDVIAELWGKSAIDNETPESFALARDLVRRAQEFSGSSPRYRKIAEALSGFSDQLQGIKVDATDLAENAGVSPNDRRDFARMFQAKLEKLERSAEIHSLQVSSKEK